METEHTPTEREAEQQDLEAYVKENMHYLSPARQEMAKRILELAGALPEEDEDGKG